MTRHYFRCGHAFSTEGGNQVVFNTDDCRECGLDDSPDSGHAMIRIEWIRHGDTSGQWRLYELCDDEMAAQATVDALRELGHWVRVEEV